MGALAAQRHADVEDALGLGADVEVRGLARDQEVPHVAVADENLGARPGAVLALLVGDDEQLDGGVASQVLQVLDGIHHRGQGALHVVDASTVELVLLLTRLELRLLARHHVHVAVEQDPRFPLPHPHHERSQISPRSRPRITRRLQSAGPEPAVDKVYGGLRGAWSERPVAHKLLREREYLRVLSYYGQKTLRFRDTNESRLFYSYGLGFRTAPAGLVSTPASALVSTLRLACQHDSEPVALPFRTQSTDAEERWVTELAGTVRDD